MPEFILIQEMQFLNRTEMNFCRVLGAGYEEDLILGLFNDQQHEKRLLYRRLEADSVRHAWYEVVLTEHPGGGFLIIKRSGASGSSGISETWFRWVLPDAVAKFQIVINNKLRKKRGRIYKSEESRLF